MARPRKGKPKAKPAPPPKQAPPPPPLPVLLTTAAARDLDDLTAQVRAAIDPVIAALRGVLRPPGVKKLKGGGDHWRIRVGDYRIVYLIERTGEQEQATVVRVAKRDEVYD